MTAPLLAQDAKTYRIERIADFLAVPPDRRKVLFKELLGVLATADLILSAARRAALELGIEEPEAAAVITGMTWTDDSKTAWTFNISEQNP